MRLSAVVRSMMRRPRLLAAFGALVLLITAVLLGIFVAVRRATPPEFDREFLGELVEHRNPIWTGPALVFNYIGGGWIAVILVPLVGVAVFAVRREWWRVLYWILAVAISAALVQLLKSAFGRLRPEEILVTADPGSFPSGHTANAATVVVVLGILVGRWWMWAIGAAYVVAMAASRTYLGAHWLSDTVGGAILGAGVALAL